MPAKVTFELYLYARGVDTPRWQGIDVFTGGHAPRIQGEQKIRSDLARTSSIRSDAARDPLKSVDPEELKGRILQRYEGTGPRGRPR